MLTLLNGGGFDIGLGSILLLRLRFCGSSSDEALLGLAQVGVVCLWGW